ncbi:MAG: hypothetical protein MUF04_14255 [Akkermansiaceae bacterium]|jgi:hypothetical protein|nr:hypothetical protein [Akkermansiaceae bacterium]
MASHHDFLWNCTVEELRARLTILAPNARLTLKAAVIDAIKAALDGEGLRRAFEKLDETERMAVAEAVHDPDHCHRPERFRAKYGVPAEFYHKRVQPH